MTRAFLFCFFALLGVLPTFPAFAQQPVPSEAEQAPDDEAARFRLAEAYLRGGQFDRAVRLLEDLYAAEPASFLYYQKLSEVYRALKRYDDAITLLDARAAGTADPALLAERGSLFYLKGDENTAFEVWDGILALRPEDPGVYQTVYGAMLQHRLFSRAIGVLEQARTRIKSDELFSYDLAYLYSLDGQHGKAAGMYAALIERDPRQLGFVRSRLARFTENGEATAPTIEVAEARVRRAPLNRALREWLAWLYLEAGDYAKALDANRAIDRMEREQGQVLFTFAQAAADAGEFVPAQEAYREILERYPDAPTAPEALYGLARMHAAWAEESGERVSSNAAADASHYQKALDTYRSFAERYPLHPLLPDVQRRIGRLELDVFHDPDAAEPLLRGVAERYANTPAGEEAAFDLGRAAILRGDLDAATIAFSTLEERLRVGDLAERTRYERALLHVYRGEFDAAQTLVEILNDNTSTDTANDAIGLTVLLIENRGPDSLSTPLQRYARAQLLLRQRHTAAALDTLDAILTAYPQHNLADEATFLRAEALAQAGRAAEAAALLEAFPTRFPQSYLADRSLLTLATIQEHDLDDSDAALVTLTRLLTDYPGSLLLPEARQRIRHLRGDNVQL